MSTPLRPPRWWQWPTVLSLDAPAVSLLWQWQLAQTARVTLGWHHAFILGAGVWLAYVADRWIEGLRLDPAQVRTPRHAFYVRHRKPAAVLWLLVFLAAVTISALELSRREFFAGVLLLAPVLAYLLSHQFLHRHHAWRAPKELCVALLIAGGASVFVVAQPAFQHAGFTAPLALFAVLCLANCALISFWEKEIDTAHGQTSLALQYRQSQPLARLLPWFIAVLALALALATQMPASRSALLCASASGLLLGFLDLAQTRLGWQKARVLADFALLTPGIPLLWETLFIP